MIRSDQFGMLPGQGAAQETFENFFRWGGDWAAIIVGAWIDPTAVDATNSPTFDLRPGLLLGPLLPNGTLRDYGPNNTDGSDQVVGVLMTPTLRMQDFNGTNQARFAWMLAAGPVKASKLITPAGLGVLDEQARAQMAGRFLFDDRNYLPNKSPIMATRAKTANYAVLASDTGTVFTTTGAAGEVDFTLPATIAKGFDVTFINTAAQTMKVIAPAGKLVAFNNAAATSYSLQTAGNEIGSGVRIIADDTSARYLAMPIGAGTVTIA